jgi:formylglycine-generating enzyme required for sulfatase activity/tRNA A-37 threonylcarbamoyl transferase component Bud32
MPDPSPPGDPAPQPSAPTIDPAPADPYAPTIDPDHSVQDTDRVVPERLGRFVVRGFLGAGAFGTVYRAFDPQLDREVALKVARPAGQSPERTQRFRREARAAAGLRHPHIVPLFEAGEADEQLYLASAFIDGTTLEDAIHARRRSGGFAPAEAAAVARKLADALAYAHGQGVLHRDVKSANVMLDRGGEPHLLDFGLARRTEDEERMTMDGSLLGTAAYLAPEAARGERNRWTQAVDQYALGVVLYELLAGQTPFAGPLEIVLALHQSQDPEPPSRKNPAVPRDLEAICLKCLEKNPARRYPSAAELGEDLRRFLDGRPTVARPVGPFERLVRWVRRKPSQAALAAGAVLVAVGLAVAGWAYQREREAIKVQGERQRQAERAAALVEALATSETGGVPSIVRELEDRREWADPLLRQSLASAPVGSKRWLHARLALLPTEPDLAVPLAEYLPRCAPDEIVVVRDALKPHAGAMTGRLWAEADGDRDGRALRAACALAGYAPDDPRWRTLAPAVVARLAGENALQAARWAEALAPVGGTLVGPLVEFYGATQQALADPDQDAAALVANAARLDVAASLLARYAADRPEVLAELAVRVDPRHYALLLPLLKNHRDQIVAIMEAEMGRAPAPDADDDAKDVPAARQANAQATLMHLGRTDSAWPLFRHTPEPRLRNYLIHAVAPRGVDPNLFLERLRVEPDLSARRALILTLGEYDERQLPRSDRGEAARRLLAAYADDPDPGLHSAIDWLLRQKWDMAADLAQADAAVKGKPPGERRWYVNGQGQTFAVIPGPAEFTIGSPPGEPDREDKEAPVERRVGRTFAIATREVTVAEFLRFQPDFGVRRRYAPEPDGPIVHITWFEAAKYCNWLSAREGIPEREWCYLPHPGNEFYPGMKLAEDCLKRTGYRLPTESEWEFAARAGAVTSRFYGSSVELLPRYGYFARNSRDRTWPCGRLKPNDLGLFDIYGNALEWCQDIQGERYKEGDDEESTFVVLMDPLRALRGGSFNLQPSFVRSAFRNAYRPVSNYIPVGLRPARTLPPVNGGRPR